jgi:hypothetical protein
MNIEEKIKETLNKNLIVEDPQGLGDFVKEMQKEGLLIKKQYDLPPLDTIGRQISQETTLNPTQ